MSAPPQDSNRATSSSSGTTLFRGGTVRTGDPSAPLARALAVRGGVVVALGEDALALDGTGVETVDLAGGLLMAGFGDGHAHPTHGGRELMQAPVRDATSVAEVAEVVRRHAADHPGQEWVLGGSYQPALAPGGVFDARWLDDAVPDRPVALVSSDHHVLWANSEALRRAGVTADTPDPPAARIDRRPDGSPVGTLVEWAAMDLVQRHIPAPGEDEVRAGVLAATRLMAAAGITWVQDAISLPADVVRCAELAASGELPVRMNLALRAEPGRWTGQRAEFAAARAAAQTIAGDDVTARTVKFFADGVVEAGTAALLEPYVDAPHSCGLPVWDADELAAAITAFDADGFQAHVHAIGDAGIRTALDAFEAAVAANGPRERRPVIAHTQLVDPADLGRFAALGVVANFSPLWAALDDCQLELTQPRLGPERSDRQYPMATLWASGAVLSFGSDWPVSSLRPLDGLSVAVGSRRPDGSPDGWLAHERLPAAVALSAYTQGVAHQAFEEGRWGTVSVGRRADLVHLASDLLALDAAEWPDVPVLGTWLGGRRTHTG